MAEHIEEMPKTSFRDALAARKSTVLSTLSEPAVEPALEAPPVAAAPPESAPESAPEPVPDYENPQFKALLTKTREQRQQLEQLQAEKAQIAAQKRTIELAERIQKGDYDAVKELGGSFDAWAMKEFDKANNTPEVQKPDYVVQLEKRLEAFENSLKQKEEQAQLQARKAAAEDWRNRIYREIDESPELKALSVAGLHDKVYERILRHAQHTQELTGNPEFLDTAKAGRIVWETERVNLEARLKALSEIDDLKSIFGGTAKPAPRVEPQVRSLMPGDIGDSAVPSTQKLSLMEKKRAALQLIAGR